MFPKECLGTYYVPAVKKSESVSNKSILAKGKLVDKVRNLIHKCDEAQPKRKRFKQNEDERNSNSLATISASDIVNDDDTKYEEDIQWLKTNRDPWDVVLQKWEATYPIRKMQKNKGNVSDFLQQWPILSDLRSEYLVYNTILILKCRMNVC